MSGGSRSPWPRRAIVLAIFFSFFAALYTAGDLLGVWPSARPPAWRDLDLAVGAAGVAALALALVLSRRGPADRIAGPGGRR